MEEQVFVPANLVAKLLHSIFPSTPYVHMETGGFPQPWIWTMLNPQPLPPIAGPLPDPWTRGTSAVPGELIAVLYADAQIHQLSALSALTSLFDDQVAGRAVERGLRLVAEADELCPRWPIPRTPWPWPVDPPRPPRPDEVMSLTESLAYGARLMEGAAVIGSEALTAAVTDLARKNLERGVARDD